MKMSKLTFAALLLIASLSLARAQGTYTQIDYPSAVNTFTGGIDTAGDIVGLYLDASSNIHGFLLSGGVYTTIDYPGATQGTALYGINDFGQIVGAENFSIGFLYNLQTQTFTNISYPGATTLTFPTSINNAGRIAGFFYNSTSSHYGFELVGTTYKEIKPAGATNSSVGGITALGDLVGNFTTASGSTSNFRFHQGTYQRLTIPNAPSAAVQGINPAGTALVGVYTPSSGVTAGFRYQNKTLLTLEFSGSNDTVPLGINAAGEVVGYFYDANNVPHGFTWTPPADAAKK